MVPVIFGGFQKTLSLELYWESVAKTYSHNIRWLIRIIHFDNTILRIKLSLFFNKQKRLDLVEPNLLISGWIICCPSGKLQKFTILKMCAFRFKYCIQIKWGQVHEKIRKYSLEQCHQKKVKCCRKKNCKRRIWGTEKTGKIVTLKFLFDHWG